MASSGEAYYAKYSEWCTVGAEASLALPSPTRLKTNMVTKEETGMFYDENISMDFVFLSAVGRPRYSTVLLLTLLEELAVFKTFDMICGASQRSSISAVCNQESDD